jgi:hypothetical protein
MSLFFSDPNIFLKATSFFGSRNLDSIPVFFS